MFEESMLQLNNKGLTSHHHQLVLGHLVDGAAESAHSSGQC